MTRRNYSRLASVEQKRNIKSAYFYILLSIIAVVLLVFLGIPTLVKFAGFVGTIGKSDKPVDISDTTPPAPPQFEDIPEFTNDENLEITGRSENGATIIIHTNGDTSEVVANSDGEFNFVFNLDKGENTINAKAKDTVGNVSTQTKTYAIYFDNTEPELEVSSPADGTSFYGSGQRQIQVKGTVDEKVNLTINERVVTVKDDGSFSYSTTLNEGTNTFEVKAIDPSSNESSSTFSINFSP
jgi:competence protein ComGC